MNLKAASGLRDRLYLHRKQRRLKSPTQKFLPLHPALSRADCRVLAVLLVMVGGVSGCARYKYRPAPLSPPALAQTLEARSLDGPDLRAWMYRSAGFEAPVWPLQTWDLNALTLAAFYYNPDLDVARANVAAASAAITTAAEKPNPSVSVGPGYQTPNPTQFITTFDFSLPIETAGKRGYRIATATQLSRASRLQLGQTAWVVRSHVRITLTDYLFAVKAAELLRDEAALRARYVDLLERRFRAGEIALPDVTAARIDETALRQTFRAAQGQVHTTRVALAAAIGLPDVALNGKTFDWPAIDQPPAPSALVTQTLRGQAIRNRLDVQRALAQYEAAQASLQLAVAKQYPDVNLGPAYAYEEGSNFISLGLSAVLPIRNRNEGPIAEAEAQRTVVGAQLLAVQSAVIADTDRSLAQYAAAQTTLAEANRSVEQLEQQQASVLHVLKAGETDQLTLVAAELQTAAAKRARSEAIHQAQLVLGSVEDALQKPIQPAMTPALPAGAPR